MKQKKELSGINEHKMYIANFDNIKQFIDAPLHTYSNGMKLRLGFAIAVHADPDVLILDGGISVGDKDFQKKSNAKTQEFFLKRKTILVASHLLNFIRTYTNRIISLSIGNIKADDSVRLAEQYKKRVL